VYASRPFTREQSVEKFDGRVEIFIMLMIFVHSPESIRRVEIFIMLMIFVHSLLGSVQVRPPSGR
jgi:hypothetical protein